MLVTDADDPLHRSEPFFGNDPALNCQNPAR